MGESIRFRAKCIITGEWVYGDLIHMCGGTFIYKCDECHSEIVGNDEMPEGVVVEILANEITIVDPKTVEQVK